MLTKSDDRKYGYLRRYTACIFIGVGSLSISIGSVRPKAVVLNNASLYSIYRKVKFFLIFNKRVMISVNVIAVW